jgi:dephospho-CoA kinase
MVPGQNPTPFSRIEPVFVGITGRIGSGKTSAAKYLSSQYGFQYTRYSRVLKDWVSSGEGDRYQLRKVGWDVMAGGLQTLLNSRLIAGLDHSRSAAIDGLRHPIDFESLSSAFGRSFRMIFLEARPQYRYERLLSRFPDLAAVQEADSHPVESYIDNLKSRASMMISNEESLESLYRQLDTWISSYSEGDLK